MFPIAITIIVCFAIKVLVSKPQTTEKTVFCFKHQWVTKGEEENKYLVCNVCHYLPESGLFDYTVNK